MATTQILKSDEKETQFIINDSIRVTIDSEKFNENGEMTVDYDTELFSQEEVANLVNSYFANLVEYLENKENNEQHGDSE
jgi:hypothetical protein